MKHTLCNHVRHYVWNNQIPPALHVQSGETVEIEMCEASDGQVCPDSSVDVIRRLEPGRANPVTGPVYIEGAEAGDALRVKILELFPGGWGWTANIPGFGLLSEEFPDPALHVWEYDKKGLAPAAFGKNAKVPLKPFIGTAGLARSEGGEHPTLVPSRAGGNMDLREVAAGAELILPVECEGALFSAGDPHAAQGDGEVCGTAIETPMKGVFSFEVIKGAAPDFPRVITNGPATRHLDREGYEITTGIGPDLMENTRNAVRGMIDVLMGNHGLSAMEAYMLCSVCADMRISQVVDAPNWTVSCYFPRIVFS